MDEAAKCLDLWRPMISPYETLFDDLVGVVLDDLSAMGRRVPPSRLVFACMPTLARASVARPPDALLLSRAEAAEHFADLGYAGCLGVEVRGAGWLTGRRYLVLLDHAWDAGSDHPAACAYAEAPRITVGPLPVGWFEWLEVQRPTRRLMHALARRWRRKSCDMPVRPYWGVGFPAAEQGCPTVSPREAQSG